MERSKPLIESVTTPALNNTRRPFSPLAHYALHLRRWFELLYSDQILILSNPKDILESNEAKERIKEFLAFPFPIEGKFGVTNTHAGKSNLSPDNVFGKESS